MEKLILSPTGFLPAPYGTAVWVWRGGIWKLHSDQSIAKGKPGAPPQHSGSFEGQFRQTPSVLRDEEVPTSGQWSSPNGLTIERARAIPGYASDAELDWLITTAQGLQPGAIWAEVGALCGRSFVAVGLSLPAGSTLITVDNQLGLQRRAGQSLLTSFEEVAMERHDLRIILIKSDSVEAAGFVPPESCDVVYLDGTHDEIGFQADVNAWLTRVAPGKGLLCGHDYGNARYPGVKTVVDRLSNSSVVVDMIWTYRP